MQSIQQMIETVLHDNQAVVLVMIVNIDGSSYRKEGTWMFLREDGSQIGMISGGCLENDLAERATKLFHTGKVEIAAYDLSAEDDLGWGRGIGCNGVVTVLVRDIDDDFRQMLLFMHKQLQANECVYFIQSITDLDQYKCLNKRAEQIDKPFFAGAVVPFHKKTGQVEYAGEMFYCQLIWPRPALYVIGAGVDARPLVQLASSIGYAVHLLDWRAEICNASHFPTAASIQIGNVEHLIRGVQFSSLDSVVLMSHDFQLDTAVVRRLLHYELLYFGILGSKKRTERLFKGEIPDGVHSPVGLSIGADGPEEIAVSIAAELIAVRQGIII